MADQNTTQVAESSTATQPTAAPIEVPTDPTAYAEWRVSGKIPEAKPEAKPDEKPKAEASAASQESEAGAKPAEKQESKKTAEHRLQEILADLRAAGLSPAELKTFKRELKQADTPPPAKAPEHTAKPAGLEAPTKPKLTDFESYDAYEEARDKYYEDLADFKAETKARQAVQEDREQRAQEAQQREINQRLDAATEKYGEGTREAIISTVQTIMGDAKIPDVLKDVLGDSPVLTDILYVLGSKADELAEFVALAHTKPTAAIRKIGVIESLVQAELTKGDGKPRSEDGKFAPAKPAESKAPEKKAPEVPPPPKELSGRGSVPPDEVENALKTGDFRAFKAAQDRRDIAKIRGH